MVNVVSLLCSGETQFVLKLVDVMYGGSLNSENFGSEDACLARASLDY